MARVVPFIAFHYNDLRYGQDVLRFVAPPYDVIDRRMENRLKDDRLNITHITLGDEHDSYATAAKRLQRWLNDEVLVRGREPCLYIYEQTFKSPDGTPRIRSGVVALVRLEEFSKGIIMPHERTMLKHKADRMELMKAIGGDTEQIFMLYDDPTGEIEELVQTHRKQEEFLRFADPEGVHHRIVKITDPEAMKRMAELFAPVKILIADGHHRYETSLEYRDWRRKENGTTDRERPYDYVMATLVSFRNPGLVIYPTHRLVVVEDKALLGRLPSELEKHFHIDNLGDPDDLAAAVEGSPDEAFGVWIPSQNRCMLARPREIPKGANRMNRLSVYILQEKVLRRILGYTLETLDKKVNIEFVKGTEPAKAMMATGEHDICFFVKPPSVHEIMAIAQTGEKMPHKSTYFYPKIWSGTLLYLFDR